MKEDNVKHHHAGHRDRMRQRFLNEGGFDNFQEHQMLEMLLFYAIPRRDTNELAHRLIDAFDGSLTNLLKARPGEIVNKTGISINTAVLISMVYQMYDKCRKPAESGVYMDTTDSAKEYFKALLQNSSDEKFYVACLNKKHKLIKLIKLSDGDEKHAILCLNKLAEEVASLIGVKYAILSHNHPKGIDVFSKDDLRATTKILEILKEKNILIMDHILVCNNKAVSMSETKIYKF